MDTQLNSPQDTEKERNMLLFKLSVGVKAR